MLPSLAGQARADTDAANRRRNDALAKGNAFLAEGKGGQAREAFVKAVDVTPEMAFQLIKVRCSLLSLAVRMLTLLSGTPSRRRTSALSASSPHSLANLLSPPVPRRALRS